MLVKELRKRLEELPDNMDVFIEQTNTEFALSLVNKAEVKTVRFMDAKEVHAKDECFVISDEI